MAIDKIGSVSGVDGGYGSGGGKLHGTLSKTLESAVQAVQYASSPAGQDGQDGTILAEITREEIEGAVNELNNVLDKVNKRLSFRVHDGSDRMIVYVIDNKTNEIVREVPPEKFLNMIVKIREFVGLLIDEWF